MPHQPALKVLSHAARTDEDVLQPFPASRKIYVTGSRPDLRVAMREISQSPTRVALRDGSVREEANPPIRVYDTSGPYSDPSLRVDIRREIGRAHV